MSLSSLYGCSSYELSQETRPASSASGTSPNEESIVTYIVQLAEGRTEITNISTGQPIFGDIAVSFTEPIEEDHLVQLGINFEILDPNAFRVESDIQRDIAQQFPGFFIYVGRVENHPFTPCVTQDVKHIHIVLKRYSSTPDDQAWAYFHLGTYAENGRKCFVLFHNKRFYLCWKKCSPNRDDLEQLLRNGLAVAFSAIGITVAAWVIAGAARVLAGALFTLLLALV